MSKIQEQISLINKNLHNFIESQNSKLSAFEKVLDIFERNNLKTIRLLQMLPEIYPRAMSESKRRQEFHDNIIKILSLLSMLIGIENEERKRFLDENVEYMPQDFFPFLTILFPNLSYENIIKHIQEYQGPIFNVNLVESVAGSPIREFNKYFKQLIFLQKQYEEYEQKNQQRLADLEQRNSQLEAILSKSVKRYVEGQLKSRVLGKLNSLVHNLKTTTEKNLAKINEQVMKAMYYIPKLQELSIKKENTLVRPPIEENNLTIQSYEESLKKLKDNMVMLQEMLSKSTNDVNLLKQEKIALEEQRNTLTERVNILENNLLEKDNTITMLQKKIEELSVISTAEKLINKMKNLQQEKEQALRELEAEKEKRIALENQRKEIESAFEVKIQKVGVEIEEIRKKSNEEILLKQHENEKLILRIKELEKNATDIKKLNEEKLILIDKSKSQEVIIKKLEIDLDQLNSRIQNLETENTQLNKERMNLIQELKKKDMVRLTMNSNSEKFIDSMGNEIENLVN